MKRRKIIDTKELMEDGFHRIANGRKRRNIVQTLEKNGVVIEGTKNLVKHATNYYKTYMYLLLEIFFSKIII
jgi:hypothetical protein